MQVFRIEPHENYTGGIALVAARDSEEAIKIFSKNDNGEFFEDYKCTCNIVIGLDFNTDKPQKFIDKIYIE